MTQQETHQEQPAPRIGGEPIVCELVNDLTLAGRKRAAAVVVERAKVGHERYGTLLAIHNGRSSVRDVREELGDAIQYLRALRLELDESLRLLGDAGVLLEPGLAPLRMVAKGVVALEGELAQALEDFCRVEDTLRRSLAYLAVGPCANHGSGAIALRYLREALDGAPADG